jgi:histidinol dehydrogenase
VDCELLTVAGDPAGTVAAIRGAVSQPAAIAQRVAEIIEQVRRGGDHALAALTVELDTHGAPAPALRVSAAELTAAEAALAPELRAGLEQAIANVHRVAQAAIAPEQTVHFEHHTVRVREAPVHRAAVYVPGGRAPYVSTVIMGVVAARAAGVSDIVVATPPNRLGHVDPAILGACRLAGATEVLQAGGAQAIAALAHGTESIVPADVIVGPGNMWVQEAKRQVSGRVGIDSFAGPSDLLVIADDEAEPEPIVLDLLAQAEHGPGTLVLAASSGRELLRKIESALREAPQTGAAGRLLHVADDAEALALAEAFAPEHLELIGHRAEALSSRVTRAGCLFVGPGSATAFGDYIAGSNHTLPTEGAARFASALGPRHFRRTFNEVAIHDATDLVRAAAPIARAEGFEVHARSMEVRIRDNPTR